MVRRLPGFPLDLGNTELRGFSGAAGNVVIDGQRPSSKSESLEAVLSRIPATRVARIDVGPGDLFGAQYAGKAQVANLILGEGSGGIEGNMGRFGHHDYTLSPAFAARGRGPDARPVLRIRFDLALPTLACDRVDQLVDLLLASNGLPVEDVSNRPTLRTPQQLRCDPRHRALRVQPFVTRVGAPSVSAASLA